MNKEILITNYYPEKLKEARELARVSYEDLESDDFINIEDLKMYEKGNPIVPVDIFLLAYIFILYKDIASEKKIKFKLTLTKNILKPHPEGLKYQEFIVAHENYSGMPRARKNDGTVNWVATADSNLGRERMDFWENKRIEHDIAANHVSDPNIRKKVAFINHPTKRHTCLYSGSKLYLDYRYPSPSRTNMINEKYDLELKYYDLDIYETATLLYDIDSCKMFCEIYKIRDKYNSLEEILDVLKTKFVNEDKRPYVSPGAMSNSPDRFDGFHSYNADIRDIADTGRNKDNLRRYTQDRRVYEMWSGGDWKKADRLYATFVKHGVSPDHIGPLSLGFTHRPKFQPMTASENSAKGNRMTYNDVTLLIADEVAGEEVITWHSKFIWDELKNKVYNDSDAQKLSSLMRKNLHHILIIFSMISDEGHKSFLEQFLYPEYSYYDYEFFGFNPATGEYGKVVSKQLEGQNQKNNADRYIRIAFESLDKYKDIKNRNTKIWESEEVTNKVSNMIEALNNNKYDEALDKLHHILSDLSKIAAKTW